MNTWTDCLFGPHGMYGFMHFLNQVIEMIEEEIEQKFICNGNLLMEGFDC